MLRILLASLAVAGFLTPAVAGEEPRPRELGQVRFARDYARALRESASSGKPVFLLFDEVPGCANCTSFGDAVLSRPLLVEAIETLFVPVVIYNNRSGGDREVLERYGEPAWNNPVVRFVDAAEAELAPRLEDTYTPAPLARRMITALERAKRPVPDYLRLLARDDTRFAPVYLAMGCFWSGEACLGADTDVAATRPGFIDGVEVVEVQPAYGVDASTVIARALASGCAVRVQTAPNTFRYSAKDDKHALRERPLGRVRLDPSQLAVVNSAIANGMDPRRWLSPSQLEVLARQ